MQRVQIYKALYGWQLQHKDCPKLISIPWGMFSKLKIEIWSDLTKPAPKVFNQIFGIELTGNTASRTLTLDKLNESIKKLKPPPIVIKVWRGDKRRCLLTGLKRFPRFHADSNIQDKDKMYIVAGVGVVGHPDIIKKLKSSGVLLTWSDEPPDYNGQLKECSGEEDKT